MKLSRVVILCVLFAHVFVAFAQKLPMTHDVYDSWKTIRQQTLSDDGKWLAYVVAPAVGDGEATIISLDGLKTYTIARGTGLGFSEDSKFVYATVVPAKADVDKAKKEKKKPEDQPKNKLALLDLSTGKVTEIERLRSMRGPDKDKGWFSYQVEAKPAAEAKPPTPAAPEKPQESKKKKTHTLGSELILREFTTGKEIATQDVADYAWSESGEVLYYVSAKEGKGDGVYILDPATGKKTTIVTGIANYKRLTLDRDGKQVAFMSDAETYEKDEPEIAIRLWTAKGGLKTIATNASNAFPDGWTIVERGALSFSKSGKRLFFATAPKPKPAPKDETPDDEKVSVDVWNWQDPLLQPMQLLQAAGERNKSYSAMIDIGSGKVMQLETTDLPSVNVGNDRDGRYALCQNSLPYRKEISWDDTYSDVYLMDLQNGNRKLLMKHNGGGVSMSTGGKYVMWHDKDNGWTSYACDGGATKQISKGTEFSFLIETHDSPSEPPTYGLAGWTKDDDAVWVYDRFDIWSLDPDGRRAPINLTIDGRDRSTRYRVLRMDPEVNTVGGATTTLSTFNEVNKDGGFATLGTNGKTPTTLINGEKQFGFSGKAKDADVVIMTRRDFNEFPDLWTSNSSFATPVKRTDVGKQMEQYTWGTSEIVRWVSNDGVSLQGILLKPENFDPRKKYPMIVYFYEDLSDGLHTFTNPTPGSGSINFSFYVSRGYMVLMPDIPYRVGYPGESAISAIIPAVQAVAARGSVDMNRLGIQGHSWGGYQVLYLVTHTNMFAAAEAGAPVANMFSAYGGIRWQTGMSRQFQYEKTQSRIGGTIWEKPLQFLENSPIFWIDKVTTPTLVLHNDADGAVPWYQGIEFFTAMRRLDKPSWLVSYNGEGHGIGKRQNQKDWAIRLQQFFDHYLMGAPAPKWMTEGVPAIDKGKDFGLGLSGGG